MWLDPSTGNIYRQPGESEPDPNTLEPLLRKAYLTPEQLTPDERRAVELKLLSTLADLLPDSAIQDILRENKESTAATADPARDEAAQQVLEGKLALRELGVVKEEPRPMALLNPATGQIITEADVETALKELRTKRREARKNKRKPKG